MRELTFRGFLTEYVKQVSYGNTNSLSKLIQEASTNNPRLKEPLFLYAVYSQKQEYLLRAARGTKLHPEYLGLLERYSESSLTELLESQSQQLPWEYRKVWNSYMSRKNRTQSDNHTKELIRQKVIRLQQANGVTNYRIYTDLKLNPGNLNSWLKNGDSGKISLDKARATLGYVQNHRPSANV